MNIDLTAILFITADYRDMQWFSKHHVAKPLAHRGRPSLCPFATTGGRGEGLAWLDPWHGTVQCLTWQRGEATVQLSQL